jgi:hypothetical protein
MTQLKEEPKAQADVLDQTRPRALRTVLRYSYVGKIVSLHLNLKNRGKTDLAVSNQSSIKRRSFSISRKDASNRRAPDRRIRGHDGSIRRLVNGFTSARSMEEKELGKSGTEYMKARF